MYFILGGDWSYILAPQSPYLYGLIALFFAGLLLITSNDFAVRILGTKWKWLHKGVYGMFYFTCIHVALLGRHGFDLSPIVLGGVIALLRYIAWKKATSEIPLSILSNSMSDRYQCNTCSWVYDESKGDPDGGIAPGTRWEDIPNNWKCPVCGISKTGFTQIIRAPDTKEEVPVGISYLGAYERTSDTLESDFRSIFEKAVTGKEEITAMGTKRNYRNLFEDIMFLPAQLAHRVYDKHEVVVHLDTVIGPKAKYPITLKLPFYVSHMSFGSLSREAKVALAKGSKAVGTMICGGEGGLLEEEFENAGVYVYEYSTGRFGATEENMKKADAIEIKI